jgi:hypothetical protein
MYTDGVQDFDFATVDGLTDRCGYNEADWLGHWVAGRAN